MSSADPLKSAISIKSSDDTSLALPSANEYHSREQRVRAQVQSIRRTKSRHSSSGRSGSATLSPTSTEYDSVFLDASKSQLSSSNGGVSLSNGSSKVFTTNRNSNNQQMINNMKRSTMRKQTINHYESRYGAIGGVASLGLANTSRSEPGQVLNTGVPQSYVPMQIRPTVAPQGNRSTYMKQHSNSKHKMKRTTSQTHPLYSLNGAGLMHKHSQYRVSVSQPEMNKTRSQHTVTDSSSKTQINSEVNENSVSSNITMQEAVQLLSSKDEKHQNCGASYIQHNTFDNNRAKEEVLALKGIPLLVGLLKSPNSQVKCTASAALRNLTFQNNKSKEEIQRYEGIPEVVAQLKDSKSAELDKHLAGLLWNLSSVDNLKADLLKNALPVLMDRVIAPYMTGSRNTVSANVFCSATACLGNLSCAKQGSRQTMRKYRGLIDGLVAYLKECVENNKTEDEALVNCVSILHNLTFHLQEEFPSLFNNINSLGNNMISNGNDANSVGCFSAQSKPLQTDCTFDYVVTEDSKPYGASLLIHSKTLQDYLSLLQLSECQSIQDGCWGILHNLTVHESTASSVISQIIVKKLKGMHYISPFLTSDKVNMQKNAMGLVINLIKYPNLHSVVGEKSIPVLLSVLSQDTAGANESDDTLALACQAASALILSNVDCTKLYLRKELIQSLNRISQNMYFSKSKKAASVLLIRMWSNKELQSSLKKLGLSKSMFINDVTMAAQKSLHIVE